LRYRFRDLSNSFIWHSEVSTCEGRFELSVLPKLYIGKTDFTFGGGGAMVKPKEDYANQE
jgi:hypothetical protein